jgi:ABC-type phosphate/phosphonate transport system substrate-binding protein
MEEKYFLVTYTEVLTMFTRFSPKLFLSTLVLAAVSTAALAADSAVSLKVGFSPAENALTSPALLAKSPAPTEAGTYVFSAPPRESAQAAAEIYGPIDEYLSAVTGKKFVYRQPAGQLDGLSNGDAQG